MKRTSKMSSIEIPGQKKDQQDVSSSDSSSSTRTRYLKRNIYTAQHDTVSKKEFYGISTNSQSSLLECNPIPKPRKNVIRGVEREVLCIRSGVPDEVFATLVFLLQDETGRSQSGRIFSLLGDAVQMTSHGFSIRILSNLSIVMDYLNKNRSTNKEFAHFLQQLLVNAAKPAFLIANSDIIRYIDNLTEFYNFIGYMLMSTEDDKDFDLAHLAVWAQLSFTGAKGDGVIPLSMRRSVALQTTLVTTITKMLALCSSERFHKFIELVLLLASMSSEIRLKMVTNNMIEHILYRFNPYFPQGQIPMYEINPKDPQDANVKLGDSHVHLHSVLSVLLMCLYCIEENRSDLDLYKQLKCPDSNAQRCWIWALRYECRARGKQKERSTMVAITITLLHCFRDQLYLFSELMPDILSLAVHTELPVKSGWIEGVNFNTSQSDLDFKKRLIYTSVLFFKIFPMHARLPVSRNWVLGLSYLVDPCLYQLRRHWSPPLFDEIRKAALQALVVVLPCCPPDLAKEYGLIRRTLWYIEWYTVSPFDVNILYWCVRVLQACVGARGSPERDAALREQADTHGLIIIINLCSTLLDQKQPPLEMFQAVLAQCLRILTSAVELRSEVSCCVYPHLRWPQAVNNLARQMLDTVVRALGDNLVVSARWIVSLFNFIWESIMWKKEYRTYFISQGGIYKILDIISVCGEAVQCIGLALLCEAAGAGEAVAQLVTWRAPAAAGAVSRPVVNRSATLATLLANIARSECLLLGVQLDPETGVIQSLDLPFQGPVGHQEMLALHEADPQMISLPGLRGVRCFTAAGLTGSRISKVYALLEMLSEDLESKVTIADEAYKLYRSVQLTVDDQVTLTLARHYLTCKLGEVWLETEALVYAADVQLLSEDSTLMDEFLVLNKGWAKEIKYEQEKIIEEHKKKECREEMSLYWFLARGQMTTALDALRDIRCAARSSDGKYRWHVRLHDAVRAHFCRAILASRFNNINNTFRSPFDAANVIGQNVKVCGIPQPLRSSGLYSHPPSMGQPQRYSDIDIYKYA